MAEFVREATKGFKLVELKSDQAGWIEKYGYPVDMVPVANSLWRDPAAPDPPKTMLQPWTSCCAKLRGEPLLQHLARGIELPEQYGHGVIDSLDARSYAGRIIHRASLRLEAS